jgi:hypothetical protein
MGKYISGFAKESNLKQWSDRAKQNSYGDNRAQCKEQLAPLGRGDRENDWSDDWKQPQKDKEGKCYTFANDLARANSFTGKGGSKGPRD